MTGQPTPHNVPPAEIKVFIASLKGNQWLISQNCHTWGLRYLFQNHNWKMLKSSSHFFARPHCFGGENGGKSCIFIMPKTHSPTIMQMEHVNILKKSRSSSKWPMFSTEPWENELSTTQVRDFSTAWLMTFSISKDREIPKPPHSYSNQKRGRCRVISVNDLCLSCLEKVPKWWCKMVMNPMGSQSNKKNITKHHLHTNQKVEDLRETPHGSPCRKERWGFPLHHQSRRSPRI